jgi:hypothetical protein
MCASAHVKLHVTEFAVKNVPNVTYDILPADGCLQIKNATGISNIKGVSLCHLNMFMYIYTAPNKRLL